MAAYPRFAFDNRFERKSANDPPPPPVMEDVPVDPLDVPNLTRRALLAAVAGARTEGYAEGVAAGVVEGERQALEGIAAATARTVEHLSERLEAIEGERRQGLRVLERDAATLVVTLVRRIAPTLLERTTPDDIERAVAEAVRVSADAPRLRIAVHPDLVDRVRALTAHAATAQDGSIRIDIIGDPEREIGAVDARWEAGTLTRDPDAIRRRIDVLCDRALAALTDAAGSNTL